MPGRDVPWLGDRRRSKPRAHTLSVDFETDSYDEWKSNALDGHLDVCVDSIAGWRYFADAVADPRATVYGARSRDDDCGRIVPVAVVWRRGNDWCSLYEGKRWDEDASEEAIQAEQACCDLLGVGTHPSPGALGTETILAHLPKNHPAPAANVSKILRDHIVGGRAELRRPVVRDQCYEIDRSMAYCAEAAKPIPVGRAVMVPEGTPIEVIESYATWFCACTVVILKPLKLGPFPIRDTYGNVSFPTRPGTYVTWLWKEEAQDCRAAGCVVDVGGGIGYRELAPVLAGWARFIFQKRGEASGRVADKVKQVAVAAIGRMAMGTVKWTIVQSYSEGQEGEPIVDENGSPLGYYAVASDDCGQARMVHWASYIWMQARRALYARQLAERGVLWSNFDSLGLARPSRLPVTTGELGAWREALLTHVVVTYARGVVCDQKVTLPGLHGEARERAIAYAVAIRQAHEREQSTNVKPKRVENNGFQEGWRAMEVGTTPIVGEDGPDSVRDYPPDRGGDDRLGNTGPSNPLSVGGRRDPSPRYAGGEARSAEGGKLRLGGPRRRPRGG